MGKNDNRKKGENKKEKEAKASKKAVKSADDPLDEQTIKAVQELEQRLQGLTEESKKIEQKMRTVALDQKKCELVAKEVQPLPEDQRLFQQFGRCYIHSSKPELIAALGKMAKDKEQEIGKLKITHAQFELKMKSEAENLKELVGPEKLRQMFTQMKVSEPQAAGGSGASK
eukprot:gnl/MRDRNA2_/MRDRNA2_148952_c0_seq1.p1 gnl/MRDRNA2_/MRDRNA2_148952_c0~~gnl/MRDRNA2_/MRDRNA2_148952_c0_seq1.p1  ORF type:complete len:171 (+),score=65.47 gnl/MRDRNA2_/MRDRNA2_148952_c0_seq1:91-603(+)